MRPIVTLTAIFLLLIFDATITAQPAGFPSASAGFAVTSTAFPSGGLIPTQYSCKGADVSPPLSWSGAPAKTASFALIMDDPDAPSGTYLHWMIWNMPASTKSLPEGVPNRDQLEDGTRQGRNSNSKIGYSGPCPPGEQKHRYFFRLYALDRKLDLSSGADRGDLEAAMQGHVLAQASYMGTFHK